MVSVKPSLAFPSHRAPFTRPLGGILSAKRARLTHARRDDQFLPGQWLDVFVPGINKPGGFTITSAPSKAQRKQPPPADAAPDDSTAPAPSAPEPYLELAVQKSPDNPPAQCLWRPTCEILHSELRVRVGGSFVWPPPGVQPMVSWPYPLSPPPLSPALSSLPTDHRRTRHFKSTDVG